ncbi:hypothetical protein NMY22_g3350 [Coprinellus aureogranulatus]|nr:hypothetical protein NMY22_g3350 [Coprinellus aureogranulatus]
MVETVTLDATVGDRVPLHDRQSVCQASDRTSSASAIASQPSLAAGQSVEAEHRNTKATHTSRIGNRRLTRLSSQLQEKTEIQALNARIRALEKSERRLKARLLEDKESLKDSQAALQAALYQGAILEERLDNAITVQRDVRAELERYRGWWINEHYCLKVALQVIVDPDDGVLAMRESSRARYLIHLASQSDSV